MESIQKQLHTWSAPEYVRNDRTVDWYWAVAILGVVGIVACVYWGNPLFGVIVLLATVLVVAYAAREVPVYDVVVGDHGIVIAGHLTEYTHISAFWIENHPREGYKLLIRSDIKYIPVAVIPIDEEIDVQALRATLVDYIPETVLTEPILVQLFEAIF